MNDTAKGPNPKQAFADRKVPVAIGSGALELWDCLGLLEGALKYGRSNWRVAGVRVSTYVDAARRHLLKFTEGEWCAPDTQIPHLVSVRACVGIILDAWTATQFPVRLDRPNAVLGGKFLTDDRIPSVDIGAVEAEATRIANHLREMFKDHAPRHVTIADTHVEPEVLSAACNAGTPSHMVLDMTPAKFHDQIDTLFKAADALKLNVRLKVTNPRDVKVRRAPTVASVLAAKTRAKHAVLDGGPGRPRVAGIKPRGASKR